MKSILMHLKKLERFLMSVEVIFHLKKQIKLEKNCTKKTAYNFLKDKEQNGSLTNEKKKVLKRIDMYLKNFKSDLEKLQKYEYYITHDLDYLCNEEEDYYKPTKVKSAFDGSYILYESIRDKDFKLSIDEYYDIIRLYLRYLIDDHKSKGEWKIQFSIRMVFVSLVDAIETLELHTKSDNM